MTAAKPGEHAIETMQVEKRRYPPSPDFSRQANAQPALFGGGIVAWPLTADAQRAGKTFPIGFLANDPTIPA